MKVSVYNKKGEKTKDLEVKSKVFNTAPKEAILRDVVMALLAGKRNAHPKTKRVGEVSGSGRKPWRQKGTGRARTGSIRNPIWRGGGNIFGPVGNENHTRKVNKKVKKQSLFMALSSKDQANEVLVVDGVNITKPKTKEIADIFSKLPLEGKKLVVVGEDCEAIKKSVRNIKDFEVSDYKSLNTYVILRARNIIFINDSLDKTIEFFGSESAASSLRLADKKADSQKDKKTVNGKTQTNG